MSEIYGNNHAAEIAKDLVVGGIDDLNDILAFAAVVLVPLDRLPGDIWDQGFRGEILYCPITDYSTLPDDVLRELVHNIVKRLENGRRVGVFCIGGHGRTGYVAACILSALGVSEPVAYLRKQYSRRAVETQEQEKAVARFICGNAKEEHPWQTSGKSAQHPDRDRASGLLAERRAEVRRQLSGLCGGVVCERRGRASVPAAVFRGTVLPAGTASKH